MTTRLWSLKPGELKSLDRGGLLLVGARSALRVERWVPAPAGERWSAGLVLVVDAAFDGPLTHATLRSLRTPLSDAGAKVCNALARTDAPLGRCHNYAVQTLVACLDAAVLDERKALLKECINATKLAASIAASAS